MVLVGMKTEYIFSVLALIIILILENVFAAGGGGGGGSSSGLGFSSRDSIFILVNNEYSAKFSLKNGTKYDLKVNADNSDATLTFGNFYMQLKEGDNFLDLNNNDLAEINFRLESINGKRADIRIIDAKEQVRISEEIPKKDEKANVDKKETLIIEDEKGLKCSNLATLKERVLCRLELEKEEQEKELELYYLPEECRALSGSAREICIARYKSVQICWKFYDNERVSCVKKIIRLDSIQKEKCNKLNGNEKPICVEEIKNKVYDLIKWRFYDLEEKAEDFLMRGFVDRGSVVDFIAKTEQNKIKFNGAKTKEERKNIILDVRKDWEEFVKKFRENSR